MSMEFDRNFYNRINFSKFNNKLCKYINIYKFFFEISIKI